MDDWNNRLGNPELRCKNKCGFYGNPIYQGFCSKCYKELAKSDSKKLERHMVDESQDQNNIGLGFTKFAIKKSIFSSAKGHNKILKAPNKKGPTGGASASTDFTMSVPSQLTVVYNDEQPPRRRGGGASRHNSDPFNEFMKTLKKPAAQDIVQHLKTFKKKIVSKSTMTANEQSEMVQIFYEKTSERLKSHPLFAQMSEEEQCEMMDGIEKHLMTSIYDRVFCIPSCDDEVKDILLLRRINMLHWLQPSHLDVALNMNELEVQQVVEQAREELWNMENKKAPQDKLNCICRSCNSILEALRISQGGPASADEFLPALIYLIIHTSCQHMYSNINYIERFTQPGHLMSGETGYYFTNICGAVLFIENISAENLKLSQDEFNCKMGYIDGKTDADLLVEEIDVNEDYERVVVLRSCCDAVKELTGHLSSMSDEIDVLMELMNEFQDGVKMQVADMLRYPPPRSLYQNNPKSLTPPPIQRHYDSDTHPTIPDRRSPQISQFQSDNLLPEVPEILEIPPISVNTRHVSPMLPTHATPTKPHRLSKSMPTSPVPPHKNNSPPPLIDFD